MNKAEFRFRSKLCIDSAPVTKSDHMQQLTECIHWKLKFTRADVACNWLTPAAECRMELLGLHIHPGWCDVVATFNTLIRPTVVNNGASVLCIIDSLWWPANSSSAQRDSCSLTGAMVFVDIMQRNYCLWHLTSDCLASGTDRIV